VSREKKVMILFCNFCGKNQKEVEFLIHGSDVYICNECVDLCNVIVTEERQKNIDKFKNAVKAVTKHD